MKVTSEDKGYIYLLYNNTVIVYKNFTKLAVFSNYEKNITTKWKLGIHEGSFCVQDYKYIWKVIYEDNIAYYAYDIVYKDSSAYTDCKIKSVEKLFTWDTNINIEEEIVVMLK